MITVDAEQLLTTREAAEVLGLRPQTLSVWRVQGRYGLKWYKIGRAVKYKMSDVLAFIERRAQSGGEADE